MADIAYIEPGTALDATHWNTLFAEADARLTKILGGLSVGHLYTSFLYLYTASTNVQLSIVGKCFFFGQNNWTDALFGDKYGFEDYFVYNHAPFTAYAAGAALTGKYDAKTRTLSIGPATDGDFATAGFTSGPGQPLCSDGFRDVGAFSSLLKYSLQAHTRLFQPPVSNPPPAAPYWLWETEVGDGNLPEHRHAYDMVELIFTASTTVPAAYDKYNFFRCHNFADQAITVRIETWSAVIPAHGSVCVRRDKAGGTYTQGWNHLHKMLPGDPRMFFPRIHSTWQKTNWNNVCNPSLVATWLTLFANNGVASITKPLAPPDPHLYSGGTASNQIEAVFDAKKFWDASGFYCGAGKPFGAMVDGTRVGDLIQQKGGLISIQGHGGQAWRFPIRFNGYGSIVGDFAAGNITVTYTPPSYDSHTGPIPPSVTLTGSVQPTDLLGVDSNFLMAFQGETLNGGPGGNGNGSPLQTLPSGGLKLIFPPWNQGFYSLSLIGTTMDNNSNLIPLPQDPGQLDTTQFTYADYMMGTLGDICDPANIVSLNNLTPGELGLTQVTVTPRFTGFGLLIILDISVGAFQGNAIPSGVPENPIFAMSSRVQASPDGKTFTTQIVAWLPSQYPALLSIFGVNGAAGAEELRLCVPRATPQIIEFRIPGSPAALAPVGGSYGSFGFQNPSWTYLLEQAAPITDDTVTAIAGAQVMAGCGMWRPGADQSPLHLTWAYAAKGLVKLIDGSKFPTPHVTYDFTAEVDGASPPSGKNNIWPGVRGLLLGVQPSSLEARPNTPIVFEQMPIVAEHYNNLASLVNAVSAVTFVPLLFKL